jgi:hypothetical protein
MATVEPHDCDLMSPDRESELLHEVTRLRCEVERLTAALAAAQLAGQLASGPDSAQARRECTC